MRRLLAVLLWALTALATAQDALVFIRPDRAGPQVPREIDPHPLWVRWGAKADSNGLNRLLEPVTGLSWNAPTREFGFTLEEERPRFLAGAAWEARGIFRAREQVLGSRVGLLRVRKNGFSPQVTPLAARSGTVDLGQEPMMVAEAGSWDEVAWIARRHRRTAVLEFPPDELSLGHLWLFGEGVWPPGVPQTESVPGLLSATAVGRLLRNPATARWVASVPPAKAAWPWAASFASSFVQIRIGMTVAFFVGVLVAVVSIARESGSAWASAVLKAALLAPYAALLASFPARFFLGPEATLPLTVFLLLGLLGIEWTVGRRYAPWAAVSALGCLAVIAFGWDESVFSGEFGLVFGLSAAALVGTLTALPEPPSSWTWGGRILVLVAMMVLADLRPEGLSFGGLWCLVACVLCGEGWLLHRSRILAGLVAIGWIAGTVLGPVFAWNGLLGHLGEAGRPNLFDAVATLLSPLFVAVAATTFLLAIFASEFLRYRIRRALKSAPRLVGFWQLAALASPLFVLEPSLSSAVPILVAGASAATLLAALRPSELAAD